MGANTCIKSNSVAKKPLSGDRRILADQWDSMKAWVDYEAACARKSNVLHWWKRNPHRRYTWDTKFHWGEWLEPDRDDIFDNIVAYILRKRIAGDPEVATAYFAYSSRLLSDIAEELGRTEEAAAYRDMSARATAAYRYLFVRGGRIDSDRQCRFVRPLALGLIEGDIARQAAADLDALVRRGGYRVGTGFLSTVFLCRVLSEYGHTETAYRLMEQTAFPSWLYPVTKGATTIWEKWRGIDENNVPHDSLNHYSAGAAVEWLFRTVAGIDADPRHPGFERFVIAPKPGGSLSWARATFRSLHGDIASAWQREGGRIAMQCSVPPNTSATLIVPCGDPERIRVLRRGEESLGPFLRVEGGAAAVAVLPPGAYAFEWPEPETFRGGSGVEGNVGGG